MKTLAESIFDDNKELTFKELTGANINSPKSKDLDILTFWLIKNTNITHYVSSINWRLGYNWDGNGFCLYKDIFAKLDGEKKHNMHYRESLLQIFYNNREESVIFVAQTQKRKKIPSECKLEWGIINDIIKSFGAQPWISDNRWILEIKP